MQRRERQIHLVDGCSRYVSLYQMGNIVLTLIDTERVLRVTSVSLLPVKTDLRGEWKFSTVTTNEIRHIALSKI